ncbi:MAG: PIN domain-containing protein [Azonexus sp.]|jgi:predicted nucleic acid-binding protein|uniref:type II toxin-antitoxin system VapC family toxin n=1 Tax=Azonexus sp. TaxID=1872668 RepID=UPI002832431C|nr:PIN domain-containing protein [Azonexus sp.]MDR0775308.1 PIN domain-containing protein [Azonexus sp.]
MTFLVDTSVWLLALRRDAQTAEPQVHQLKEALLGSEIIVTTGLIVQELLQGFLGPKAQTQIIERFAALPLLQPDRDDHINAAILRNTCRRVGVQLGTVDALLAQLCIRHDVMLLTTDKNFTHAAEHCPLRIWSAMA